MPFAPKVPALLLAALTCAPALSQAPDPIVDALRRHQFQTALTLTQSTLAAHPNQCRAESLQGLAYSGLNQPDQALKSFQRSLTHCPDSLVSLEGAAQIQFARSDPYAIPLLEKVVAQRPADVTAHAMLATLLSQSSQCEQALPHFVAAAVTIPGHPAFQQSYARCLAQTKDYPAAIEQFRQIAATNPSDPLAYNIALLQWKNHQPQDALTTLAPLLESRRFQPAFALAAKTSEEAGETPRAVELLRTAIELNPDDVDSYLDFSNLAYDHASFPVGVEMLNVGLKRLPEAARLYLARGVLEVQMSHIDQALLDFAKAHQLDSHLSFAVDAMGLVQSQQHQDAAALARFQQEVKSHPKDPFLQYLLAEQLSQSSKEGTSDLKAAIAAATTSTDIDPTYQPAQDLLILLLMRANQPALAIDHAERAVAINPNDDSALYQELLALRKLHKTESIPAVTARFTAARRENALRQQRIDHYHLQGENEK